MSICAKLLSFLQPKSKAHCAPAKGTWKLASIVVTRADGTVEHFDGNGKPNQSQKLGVK